MLICSLFLLGIACNNEDSLTATVDPAPISGGNTNPYAVTVEEALANLDGVLAQIDGETRAGGMRRAVSVDRVKAADVCDLTRSEAALDVEDLLYVVSFGEGNGSAVLGADKRVTEVMAVLDETVLTVEDFAKFDTRTTSLIPDDPAEKVQNMLTERIVRAAQEEISTNDITLPGELPIPMIGKDSVITNYNRDPLLNTKWGRGHPFNWSFPVMEGMVFERVQVPGASVAVGQMLSFYQQPSVNVIGGTLYDWSVINQLNLPATLNTTNTTIWIAVSDYLYGLSEVMGVDYSDSDPIPDSMVTSLIHNVGFYNTLQDLDWDMETAYTQIYTNGKPVLIKAQDLTTSKKDYWVLDGWKRKIKELYRLELFNTNLPPRRILISTTVTNLVHCNFGLVGTCDGYYTPGIYNRQVQLNSQYIDTEAGDEAGTATGNFTSTTRMILFN